MMRRIAYQCTRATGFLLLVVAGFVAAPHEAAAQDARAFIGKLGREAIEVMGPAVPPVQRAARFRQLFDNDFALPEIARFVLGPHARALPPEQQEEFLAVFRESLVQAYSKRLAEYAGEPFRVTGSRPTEGGTLVASQVVRRSGPPIAIDWQLIERDGHYQISDVAIDGVSMKVTQRNTFAGIIQRNGGNPEALIAVLRQELAQPSAGAGSSIPPAAPMR